MGFDLYGMDGRYFRANIWSWHPMVQMICETGVLPKDDPDIGCIATNDGYHVVGALAVTIADALERKLAESPGVETFTLDDDDGPRVDEHGFLTDRPGLPAFQVGREKVEEFIRFCRSCSHGGYEIW